MSQLPSWTVLPEAPPSTSDMDDDDGGEYGIVEEPLLPQSDARKKRVVRNPDNQRRKRKKVGMELDADSDEEPSPTRKTAGTISNPGRRRLPDLSSSSRLQNQRRPSPSSDSADGGSLFFFILSSTMPSMSTSRSQPVASGSSSHPTPGPSRAPWNATSGPSSNSQPTPTSIYSKPKPKPKKSAFSVESPLSSRLTKHTQPASLRSSSSDWEPPVPTLAAMTSPEREKERWRRWGARESGKKRSSTCQLFFSKNKCSACFFGHIRDVR